MDSDKLFREYLNTWPSEFIMWPTEGQEKLKGFFTPDEDPFNFHYTMDDLFDYIKQEILTDKVHYSYTASEWFTRYFKTVRGRDMAKAHLKKHEPLLAVTSFNIEPIKGIMDGFINWVIAREVMPCLK